jgi:hypothetical protein
MSIPQRCWRWTKVLSSHGYLYHIINLLSLLFVMCLAYRGKWPDLTWKLQIHTVYTLLYKKNIPLLTALLTQNVRDFSTPVTNSPNSQDINWASNNSIQFCHFLSLSKHRPQRLRAQSHNIVPLQMPVASIGSCSSDGLVINRGFTKEPLHTL